MKNDKKAAKLEAHKKQIRDLSFTADNTRIVSVADDYAISIFDIIKNEKIYELSGHKGNINTVHCHPTDKTKVLTASYDRTLRIWDLEKRECLHSITLTENIWCARFSHDGSAFGAGRDFIINNVIVTDDGVISLYKL
jgi:coatomer protein complex subunit alpha (xenin)